MSFSFHFLRVFLRFTNVNVQIQDGIAYVQGDVVAAPGLISNVVADSLGEKLSEEVGVKVVLEFGIILEEIVRSRNPEPPRTQ